MVRQVLVIPTGKLSLVYDWGGGEVASEDEASQPDSMSWKEMRGSTKATTGL